MSDVVNHLIQVDISPGIQVGGFHYAVDTSKEAHKRLRASNVHGQCDFFNQIISVDHDLNDVEFSSTFIHEVIEAVNYHYCADNIAHDQISQLEFGLHQVCESLGVRFGK